ncbi:MAG: glycosyltransferase family 4 protein [Candidatus Zambryskibacteria bacterium]|nr:glycosyltransferase family 4 protein [Candidatus Zambryskibacteria bacterium]
MTNNLSNKTKKKILIFSTAYYPFVGGAEVAVKEITDRLSKDFNFEFDLITAKLRKDLPNVEKVGSVNVYRLGIGRPLFDKLILPFRGAFLARRLNKKADYFCLWGIMVTFGSLAGYLFNILQVLTRKKKIPIVLTLQEGDSENHLQYKWIGLIALSWKLSLWRTDFLTGISNFLLNRAKKNGYKGKYSLVPNGVDLSIFSQQINLEIKNNLKNSLGKKSNDIFLVTSGRLTRKNAIDDVISALVYLPKNVYFIIIGKGEEGPCLQKQAQTLKVDDRVKFLGFISYQDIPRYFSICDVFIRPSRSEGFGNSFIEAMASGLPVIATPVGGIPDFIDDKETGVFCSPDNPQSIVKAIGLILNDNVLRERIIYKAYERVKERYGWDHIAGQMKAVFDKISHNE